ncbi:hypothetical protein STA3757_38640 [Stanieria sp. NIES-3757]|nr:hypothetical protein STA3757_38640 [Stanieria sp. NIES-3757]
MELNEFLKQCEDDDVLCWKENLFKFKTIKYAIEYTFIHKIGNKITESLKQHHNINISDTNWFENGIPFSILKSGYKGWQKGKLKIKVVLEFEPDEPEKPESPLDDIRQDINEKNI